MGFQAPNAGNNVRAINMGGQPANQNWKSDAFINLSLPVRRPDGSTGQAKIGALQLKLSKDLEARLIEAFREDPENAAERLKEALIIDFREAGQNAGAELLF